MATKPIVNGIQDMPPPGGYPEISYRKGIRPRGPSGLVIWASIFAMTTIGFYSLGNTSKRNRLAHKGKREARMAITPFLMAEKDRHLLQMLEEIKKEEEAIMKNQEGFVPAENLYSKRWVMPKSVNGQH